mgnify:CR=1 FL=1
MARFACNAASGVIRDMNSAFAFPNDVRMRVVFTEKGEGWGRHDGPLVPARFLEALKLDREWRSKCAEMRQLVCAFNCH